ncbi:hypothetical protein H8356DRAFT_1342092 [Neocallimastix lanati (nom. inval.)]|nr:hypothetical protein H8356DRAFT_1342092 [Neocallimastix sp. JGI-2020a]
MSSQNYNPTGTKILLDDSNFNIWKDKIYILLRAYDLYKYIKKSDIPNDKLNKHIEVDNDDEYVFDKSVTNEMILIDIKARFLISNSISDKIRSRISFIDNFAYDIYKTLKETYTFSDNEKKYEIIKRLEEMKENNLCFTLTDREKVDYVYNALYKELFQQGNSHCPIHAKHILNMRTIPTIGIRSDVRNVKNMDTKRPNGGLENLVCRGDEAEEEIENFIIFKIDYPEHEYEANSITNECETKLENNCSH